MHREIDTGLRNVSSALDTCTHAHSLTLPSNSTTKGIYAHCVTGHTRPWTRTRSQIYNVGSLFVKIVEQNSSTTKMRRMCVGVKTGCSASTIKCASYGKVSERARRWSCPSKHHPPRTPRHTRTDINALPIPIHTLSSAPRPVAVAAVSKYHNTSPSTSRWTPPPKKAPASPATGSRWPARRASDGRRTASASC